MTPRFTLPIVVFAAAVLLGGCGGRDVDVSIRLREFRIDVDPPSTKADTMSMDIDNTGRQLHELVVVRADGGLASLPVHPDGSLDVGRATVIDRVPAIAGGVRYRATVPVIPPGEFYIVCVVVPDGEPSHFERGMHARVRIEENPELQDY